MKSLTMLSCLTLLPFALGCGGGGDQSPTAKVTGKVVFDGKPVTGGNLTFLPKPSGANEERGKPGTAVVNDDGTFSVSTYGDGDGAVVGVHNVTYSAPSSDGGDGGGDDGHDAGGTASPFEGLKPKDAEVTVDSGDNDLTIELVK